MLEARLVLDEITDAEFAMVVKGAFQNDDQLVSKMTVRGQRCFGRAGEKICPPALYPGRVEMGDPGVGAKVDSRQEIDMLKACR